MINAIKIGDQLPDISEKITINPEKPLFINFFATWCGPCMQEMPDMNSLYNKYKDKVQFLFVHCGETQQDIELFIKKNNFDFKVFVDSDNTLAQQFNVLSIPLTIITNNNKIIQDIIIGAHTYEEYEKQINKIL